MSNPTATEILANLRRARRAVRGAPAKPAPAASRAAAACAAPQPPQALPAPAAQSGNLPVIVTLPDELAARGEVEERGAEQPVLKRAPSVRAIINAVAAAYGISPLDLISARRTCRVIGPRHLAMYLARHLTTRSLPEIGRFMGGKDHTTVLWGVRKTEAKLARVAAIKVDRTTTLPQLVEAHRIALENK